MNLLTAVVFLPLLGALVRVFQNGDVQRYAALMALAAAVIVGAALGMGGHP